MPNISKQITGEREGLVKELLEKGVGVAGIQDLLKATYGFRMNIAKIYKIKNNFQAEKAAKK